MHINVRLICPYPVASASVLILIGTDDFSHSCLHVDHSSQIQNNSPLNIAFTSVFVILKWEGHKVPRESLLSKWPQKLEPRTARTNEVLESLCIALNNRELVKAEVFEKRMFEQMTLLK